MLRRGSSRVTRRLGRVAICIAAVVVSLPGWTLTAGAVHLPPECMGLVATHTGTPGGPPIAGTSGNDVIVGTAGADVINGFGGDDVICGLGGDDNIRGGHGDDVIDGGPGNDFVHGGQGEDRLAGDTGDDELDGSDGDDLLNGGDGVDKVVGGPGFDACGPEKLRRCDKPRKGTLVVGETFAIPTTNPAVSTAGSVHAYWEIMYNGLLALDEDGNPQPELAVEVPTVANGGITDGGATYTLRLRDDVYWHDDDPSGVRRQFTATDVKFTFEKALLVHHARTRNMASALASWDPVAQVASIDVVDPFTVRFRFAQPYAPLLQQLNVTEAPMIPAHLYSGNPTLAQLNTNTVGTGPFEYGGVTATQARVVRNPDYFKEGLPFLDEIVMVPLVDDTARYNALVSGQVDFLWDVPNPNVAELEANPAFRTGATQSLGGGPNSIDQLIFNLTVRGTGTPAAPNPNDPARYGQIGGPNPGLVAPPHPILGALDLVDPDGPGGPAPAEPRGLLVRRGIFHAIDRNAYLNVGRNGIGTVATAPISSELPQHADDIVLPGFDRAAANALLDAAGWNGPRTPEGFRTSLGVPGLADGTPLALRMLHPSAIFASRVALIDSDLAAVGIDVQVVTDFANANALVFTHRNFDLFILNYAQGYDPHIGVRRQYHSDQVSTTGTPNNAPGYKNPAVDADFDNAVKTIDPAERFALYHDFQVRVAHDLPYVWLIETPNVRGWTAQCRDFKIYTGLFAESAWCF
ncbi:MAG TPA: ABC transporter substrate-binding protein [Acidimicrobiales bacterium]|nr:ABC transporter substrate-binding protein [Acidimicrobiales bacterium]